MNVPQPRFLSLLIVAPLMFFSFLLLSDPEKAFAQEGGIAITAQPLDPKTLPFPGAPLILSAEVTNSRDFRLPVRLLAVRDGKFQEIAVPSGLLSIKDRPRYQVEIAAPLAEISYQFVIMLPDGTVKSSARLSVRRNCIPDISAALGDLPEDIDGSARFTRLLVDNKRLEQEIDNLERASSHLTALTELVAQ